MVNKYLLEVDNSCKSPAEIAATYGINILNGKIVKCDLLSCSDCRSNYLQCADPAPVLPNSTTVNCNLTQGYYKSASGCLYAGDLPSGKGLNLESRAVGDCLRYSCFDCRFDSSRCMACTIESNSTLATVNG